MSKNCQHANIYIKSLFNNSSPENYNVFLELSTFSWQKTALWTFPCIAAPCIATSVILFVRILHVFLSNTNWYQMYLNVWAEKYVHIRTGYAHTYVQDTSLYVCDTDMSVSHTDMSVSHTYSKYLAVFAILHVSARILANGPLLLPPVPICSPAFACALARGRYSSLARLRAVAALLLWRFCRAGSAGAGK